MEIDNDRKASRAKMILISAPFIALLVTSLLALFLLINTWLPAIISGILMFTGWVIIILLRLTSVKFRFSDDTISILYYPISPMTSNFKRIDIPSDKLVDFEIKTSFLGLRKDLLLFESIRGETAAYPPVSITLCSSDGILRMKEVLNTLSRKNR